jgi:MGT family glycosyltransferase
MAPHWEAADLAPDRYAGCYRGLYLDIYPSSLCGEDLSHVGRVQPVRPAEGTPASGDLAYVTFGTVFNVVDEGFRAAVLAAADVAEEVLVTVGRAADPALLGDVPGNVTVERFVPQAEVLPRSAVVVCHGGSGTVLAALAHGVPVLCLPRGADQFANATNVARVGAGADLRGPAAGDPAALRAALHDLLHGPGPRAAAAALAAEIAAMPSPDQVAEALERFVEAEGR